MRRQQSSTDDTRNDEIRHTGASNGTPRQPARRAGHATTAGPDPRDPPFAVLSNPHADRPTPAPAHDAGAGPVPAIAVSRKT